MRTELGTIEALFRYPVKSMRGEALDTAALGLHGIEGDRRLALRRRGDHAGNPWLSASKLPALVQFTPRRRGGADDVLPTHVVTPEGDELPVFGDALAADIARRHGEPVEVMHLRHGVFDDASVSVITSATVGEVCRLADVASDARRFRPNILVRSTGAVPFEEDAWVGGVLVFGDDVAAVAVTARDVRCVMMNFDPDGGPPAPGVLKAAVRANDNNAGVYATVTRTGALAVGQRVVLER